MSKLQSLSEGDDPCEEEINAEESKRDAKCRMGCDTVGPYGESHIWTKIGRRGRQRYGFQGDSKCVVPR